MVIRVPRVDRVSNDKKHGGRWWQASFHVRFTRGPTFYDAQTSQQPRCGPLQTHLSTGGTFINRSSRIVLHPLSGTSLLFSIIFLANGVPRKISYKQLFRSWCKPTRVILTRAKVIYPRPDTIWFECKTPLLLFWFIRIFICQRDKYESI